MTTKKINQPPLHVSPIIKLLRWSCLIYGVVYGFTRRRELAAIEKVIREEEERLRPEREARIALERKRLAEAEIEELKRIFLGTTSPEKQDEETAPESEQQEEEKGQTLQIPEREERITLDTYDENTDY